MKKDQPKILTGRKKFVILGGLNLKFKLMDLTKLQLSELICKHAEKKNGLHDLMEIMLESMMFAERGGFLADNPGTRVTATVRDAPMDKAESSSSVFPATDTATFIRRYSPYRGIRRRNATGWQEFFIPRVLRRSR